jgi:hypothetical protein
VEGVEGRVDKLDQEFGEETVKPLEEIGKIGEAGSGFTIIRVQFSKRVSVFSPAMSGQVVPPAKKEEILEDEKMG